MQYLKSCKISPCNFRFISCGSKLFKSFSDFIKIILCDAWWDYNVYCRTIARLSINGLMLLLTVAGELFSFSRTTASSLFKQQSQVTDTAIPVRLHCLIDFFFSHCFFFFFFFLCCLLSKSVFVKVYDAGSSGNKSPKCF